MARIHITIDIPKDGPAQVSITTEDNVQGGRTTQAPRPGPSTIAQSDTSDLGDFRATREARGWTQRELAKRIGCSLGTVTLIERGQRPISDRLRARIQKAGIVLLSPNGNGTHRGH
jgi:DNA-binding XRE family transcriptional regulator